MALEGVKHSFQERYDLLAGEKASLEDKVVGFDKSVEPFSQYIEVLVEEKMEFEDQVDHANRKLGEEMARRKSVEDDLGWLLQRAIIRVVDKVVESSEFAMGVKRMKMVWMAVGVENGM